MVAPEGLPGEVERVRRPGHNLRPTCSGQPDALASSWASYTGVAIRKLSSAFNKREANSESVEGHAGRH